MTRFERRPPPMIVDLVVLEGPRVRLVPLERAQFDALWDLVASDAARMFAWYTVEMGTREGFARWFDNLLDMNDAGVARSWTTCARDTGEIVGSTSFLAIDAVNRHVEIGSTWLVPRWQRTFVNTEAKHLQMAHAFEMLGCVRVELKTDALNLPSRNAQARIGCRYEGTFRNHMICESGRVRDTAWTSVTVDEWPDVKRLQASLLAVTPAS